MIECLVCGRLADPPSPPAGVFYPPTCGSARCDNEYNEAPPGWSWSKVTSPPGDPWADAS